ncbi:preprotein translocase subunit SecG [Corynebacterium halotolerans]|uniref:Protein-export membrane protein SecG n=1 Tax=Corynebacterium halotolerans YIM 70093 = DSM 44683 TaxID=1121362 RepID=M1NMF6_9CORY|nr:preprotein translocase subunit SecG [Corynebacterium halotolerans]AGF72533.1 preprotein translocase subunit SecG [Corynebacterium halotolerans YIM 70093 = DSM 44683]
MTLALQIILVLSSILLTVFVLLHKGKGGGLSSLFGGGVQSNLSGSTVVEKNLDRYTVLMVVIWVACIIALNLLQAFSG